MTEMLLWIAHLVGFIVFTLWAFTVMAATAHAANHFDDHGKILMKWMAVSVLFFFAAIWMSAGLVMMVKHTAEVFS